MTGPSASSRGVDAGVQGLEPLGRVLLIVGGVLVVLGLVFVFGGRIPFLGRLPGDIHIEREGLNVFIPITTMLLVSLVLSLLLGVFGNRGDR